MQSFWEPKPKVDLGIIGVFILFFLIKKCLKYIYILVKNLLFDKI